MRLPGLPQYATHKIKVIAFCGAKVGTPAADFRIRIYTGADTSETLLATSQSIQQAVLATGSTTECHVG